MPLLEGHAQLRLIGEKGGAPFWKGAHLLERRAPFGRACTFWKGMPLLEGHAQLCLFDRKGRAPVGQCTPKGEWHSWELNLLIQHTVSRWCSSGCVHEGCGGVHHWLQTEDQAPQDFLL
jgi:hypothetical protein